MKGSSVPLWSVIMAGVMLVSVTLLVIVVEPSRQTTPAFVSLVGFCLAAIPSLLGMGFAERASRDIRNGVVTEKAREGAVKALRDEQIVRRDGPVITAELAALSELLRRNTAANEANTGATQTNTDVIQSERNSNG